MTEFAVFATGLRFPEGPAFDHRGHLVVVELGGTDVVRFTPDGERTVLAAVPGSPNGAAFGPDGTLFVCDAGGRCAPAPSTGGEPGRGGGPGLLHAISPDGALTTVITEIGGTPLSSPNDVCVDGVGGLYFTDPRWEGTEDEPVPPGSVCYRGPDGEARRLHTGLRFPNGLALSPSGAILYVTESATGEVWSFAVEAPGALGAPRRFGSCGAGSYIDGLAVDVEGRLLVASHGRDSIQILSDQGDLVGEVAMGPGSAPSNLCFGGPDHRTAFVTAAGPGEVICFEWSVPGVALPGEGGA